MKSAWIAAALLAATACEPASSKLDKMAPAEGAIPSGDLEARVARLEKKLARVDADALGFLATAYEARVEAETKPQPGVVYGVDIAQNVQLGQVEGSPEALVTIIEAWDFAWPHCYRASLVLDELLKEYEGKVRVVLKHMVVHPQQVAAAHLASCAAAKQGKFKEFYKAFWEHGFKAYSEQRNPALLGEENVFKIAGDLGLDVERLKADMPSCQQFVQADEAELRKFKVSGTPAFFINGEFIGGGIPKEAFKQHIDRKLKIAQASGVPGAEYYEKEIRGKGEKAVTRRPRGQ